MPRTIAAIRILPMSDRIEGFRNRTIADVQRRCFLQYLPAHKGAFPYPKSGLNADPGTLVLFQFQARVIASAVFLRDEKYEKPVRGCAGTLWFDVNSILTFDPIDAAAMKRVWPGFRGFGHVKQRLNPGLYAVFRRRLKNLRTNQPDATA